MRLSCMMKLSSEILNPHVLPNNFRSDSFQVEYRTGLSVINPRTSSILTIKVTYFLVAHDVTLQVSLNLDIKVPAGLSSEPSFGEGVLALGNSIQIIRELLSDRMTAGNTKRQCYPSPAYEHQLWLVPT